MHEAPPSERDSRRKYAAHRIVAMCAEVALPQHQAILHTVAEEIRLSKARAAGPAVRLAETVWHGHYRRCHAKTRIPNDLKAKLVEDEAQSYNHLITTKLPAGDPTRHHVWKGIEAYRPVRESLFGQGAFFFGEMPPIGAETSPLRTALFRLDTLWAYKGKPYLAQVRNHLLMVAPHFTEGVEHLVAAVRAFEKWSTSRRQEDQKAYLKANNALLTYLHRHSFHWQLPLGEAANIYLNVTNFRSQASA